MASGLQVYDVYGMTETTGAFTSNGPDHFKLGTVGRPNPGIEVRLGEDGEILVRGPVNTPGYHRQEAATRALIDEDGWIHTGDIGTVDEDGFYSVIDRKKELIITSAGKNIAPSNIENYLKESPIVGHAMALGDNRSYVVAILTLDGEIAPLVAAKMGVEFTDLADLSTKPQIRAMAQAAVDAGQRAALAARAGQGVGAAAHEWTASPRSPRSSSSAGGQHQVRRRGRPSLRVSAASASRCRPPSRVTRQPRTATGDVVPRHGRSVRRPSPSRPRPR